MHVRQKRLRSFLYLAALVSFICAVVLGAMLASKSEPVLEVAFLDVGQGDAIYIETPSGSQVLIDGGPGSAVLRELSSVMPFWDRSIDVVVATHPHADHIGGLVEVFRRFDVGRILDASVEEESPVYEAYVEEVAEEKEGGAKEIAPARGTQIVLDRNLVLTILSREVVAASDVNDASIVLRLDYGELSFLFTGDATAFVERELLQFANVLDVDVLKVGHHGSDTSTSPEFVSAVSPEIAVISVGADNRYGHPTEVVLETLRSQDVEVFRTDENGTVRFISNGATLRKKPIGILGKLLGI